MLHQVSVFAPIGLAAGELAPAAPLHSQAMGPWQWASAGLGIALIAVTVYAVIVNRRARMMGAGRAQTDAFFRNEIASYLLNSSIWGLLLIAVFVIVSSSFGVPSDTAKQIFDALLPVFGTWVGTLLAFYFSRENFEAASKSVIASAKNAAQSGGGRLETLAAKEFMIPPTKIITISTDEQGKADANILLIDLISYLHAKQRDRLPFFVGNRLEGPAKCVVHLSRIEKYLAGKLFEKVPAKKVEDLRLSDMLTEGLEPLSAEALALPLTTGQLAPVFKGSFSLVKESATLAEAKAAMDAMSSAPGVAGNCYDIFVTATGSASEPVLGWITNDVINENAKL